MVPDQLDRDLGLQQLDRLLRLLDRAVEADWSASHRTREQLDRCVTHILLIADTCACVRVCVRVCVCVWTSINGLPLTCERKCGALCCTGVFLTGPSFLRNSKWYQSAPATIVSLDVGNRTSRLLPSSRDSRDWLADPLS
jgi:hypothetical protein